MELEETEYQCSECGTEIQADTKECPNCGAVLEDLSVADTFEEIPVTSHPADLSTILSLLVENKIEYSINDNAMENVWGPSFTQVPKLLVRKEQVDAVKEIIKNIIEEEVEILDTEVFNHPSSVQEDKKEQIKGVEGWLLFFCMMLIFSPIAYIPYSIDTYQEIQDEVIRFPLKDTILTIDLISSILISCLSIYTGLMLWRIRPHAIKTATLYLNVVLVYSMIIFLIMTIIFYFSEIPFNTVLQFVYGQMIRETISSITFVVIWKLYLKNSERVKNTFSLGVSSTIQH
jgi:hypothetical protein